MSLIENTAGHYSFSPAANNSPYSSGVIAATGYEIVRATLHLALPWQAGLAYVERHLATVGQPKAALCAIELRCAEPYPPDAWVSPGSFNDTYVSFLHQNGFTVDGAIPVARTNVAPGTNPPAEQMLYSFSYTIPSPDAPPTFVIAGAAETPGLRPGETSLDALAEKTRDALATIDRRMSDLGADWGHVTEVGMYTVYEFQPYLVEAILKPIGLAAAHGIHWYYSRPPITDRDVEIDARGIRINLRVHEAG